MSAPDELRTAAERLEERAVTWDEIAPTSSYPFSLVQHAREDRAVAALLRAVADRPVEETRLIFTAALAVARVVAGDPT